MNQVSQEPWTSHPYLPVQKKSSFLWQMFACSTHFSVGGESPGPYSPSDLTSRLCNIFLLQHLQPQCREHTQVGTKLVFNRRSAFRQIDTLIDKPCVSSCLICLFFSCFCALVYFFVFSRFSGLISFSNFEISLSAS